MENVLTAVIVIFLFLFAGFTLSETLINSQETLATAELLRDDRLQEQAATHLEVTEAITRAGGMEIQLTVSNTGSTKLYDFARWDVISEYTDETDTTIIRWHPYAASAPFPNEWTVESITVGGQPEQYEPGILNPGEAAIIVIALPDAVQVGSALNIAISTENARTTMRTFPRNAVPSLDVHQAMRIANHATETITPALLSTSDTDDPADSLRFTVNTAPIQGNLSSVTFTQADINAGNVSYTHSGTGNDSFTFEISDGKDTIGEFTFHVFISAAPVLAVNTSLTTTVGGTGAINNTLLMTVDSDDSDDELIYTVVAAPVLGYLSIGTTFTQADIDAGLLTYTATGAGLDQFSFTVTDGETTIGPYVYLIQVV